MPHETPMQSGGTIIISFCAGKYSQVVSSNGTL